MKYIRIKWNHTNPDEPVWLFSEVDPNGLELRKIECFRNGFCDIATGTGSSGSARVSSGPLPEMMELVKDPEFDAVEIAKEEFEEVWAKRRFNKT